MSQHKENPNVTQSPLDPHKMENEAEHFKNREADSTSVSSASSSTSVTSEIASVLVSETLDRAAANVDELMQSISRWEAEERSEADEDKSSAACHTHQKVERQLQRFFGLRRVFAESQGETPEDLEMDSTPGPSGQEGHLVPATVTTNEKSAGRHGSKMYKKLKSAWKSRFRRNSSKNVQLAEEQDLDEAVGSESSDSTSGSPCPEETSPTASIGSSEDIRAAEKVDLVTDMDETPGPSLVLPGAEHVDEVVGSASSDSTSKDTNFTKPESPFPREMSSTEMDAPSQEDNKDVCESFLTVSTQKSCDSDRTDEKSAGRHGSKMYKKLKSAWKSRFRRNSSKNVQLAEEQDLDEAVGSESSDSTSGSPCPEETSPTASIGSSEDIRAAEKADLVTDMDETPGPSLVLPGAEHVDEVVGSASSDSTSKDTNFTKPESPFPREMSSTEMDAPSQEDDKDVCESFLTVSTQKSCDSDRTDEKSAGRHGSKTYKKLKSAWKSRFRRNSSKNVQLAEEQDLDEAVGSESSDWTSGSPCPEETSPTASMCSSDDIRAAEKVDLSSDPLELVADVEHKDMTAETQKGPSTLSPTGSSQPAEHCEVRSALMEEDLVMASPPGPSGQDGHLEPSQVHLGTEQNVAEINETASSDLTSGSASPKEMSPTASVGSSEDIKKADLSSVPLEQEDNDVTPEAVREEFMEDNQVTHMDATPGPSLDVRAAMKVHQRKPLWFCRCRKTKVHPISDEQEDEAVRSSSKLSSGHTRSLSPRATSNTYSVRSSKVNSTSLELVDYVEDEDEDATSEETGNAPSSCSIGWFPPACLEDEGIVPHYRESPPLSETQTKVRSSSSGDGNCQSDVGTEEVVMAASDTDVNKTQAEKRNRICQIFCKGKKEDKKNSGQDQAIRTKKPSLQKRIRLFFCHLCCWPSCCLDVIE